jgi:hypothetical protein
MLNEKMGEASYYGYFNFRLLKKIVAYLWLVVKAQSHIEKLLSFRQGRVIIKYNIMF